MPVRSISPFGLTGFRPLAPVVPLLAWLVLAGPALAQQTTGPARSGEVMGMRYLSWSGKTPAGQNDGSADGLRRAGGPRPLQPTASTPTRYPGIQVANRPSRYGVGTTSNGLTPAGAWMNGNGLTPAPSFTRPQAPAPAPLPVASGQQQYQPSASAPSSQSPPSQATPPTAPQTAQSAPVDDPMAPRRDALIFRMQSAGQPPSTGSAPVQTAALAPTPAPTPTYGTQPYAGAEPPREGARYYSVHRADGHQPDPITMPESVYLDAAPVDLAEPPATPTRAHTVNGRTQTVVPNQDPTLP